MGFGKRSWMFFNLVLLVFFFIYLSFTFLAGFGKEGGSGAGGLFYITKTKRSTFQDDLSQEAEDDLALVTLDPFKDMKKIKEIAARKYQYRRSILTKTCEKLKGILTFFKSLKNS